MQLAVQWQTVEGQIAPWARMQEVMTALKDYGKNSRVKVPSILTEVKARSRVQTHILNLDAVSRALGHPLIYIMKYFSYKLGTMIYKKKGGVIVHGLHGKKKLHQLIKDFSQKFVLCPKCKKRTALSANGAMNTLEQRCRECDYEGHLYSTDKLSRFIWRNKTMEPMSQRMRTTLPKSKETSYAARFKSISKNALVAKSAEPAVKFAAKFKSIRKNALVAKSAEPAVKVTTQNENILSAVCEIKVNKQMGKRIPKSKETNCADKLRLKRNNTVVVEATAPTVNATKPKKNSLPVVRDIPRHYTYTDIQDDEYFLSDYTDSEDYEHYRIEFEESEALPIVENNLIIKSQEVDTAACGKRKLFPKILITRVPKNVKEEDITENLKDKNPWLRCLIKNENDFKKVATLKPDTNGRPQYIIKCSPQIRRNIAACGDELNILDKFCKVYDRYHVIRCIKCQKFGHMHDQCTGELLCPKCGKEHWLRDCNSEKTTCLFCQGPHITGNRSCQKYKEEEARIKDRTDHGEHLEVMPDLQSEGAERRNITTKQQIIKTEAQRKKKEKKMQVNVESNKKLKEAVTKNTTDLVVKRKKQKQKMQLTVEIKKIEEALTKNTTVLGEQQVIIPVVKSNKKKQKKQLTMENNNKVKAAGTNNTTDKGEQQVIKPVVKRRKEKQKMQMIILHNNNKVKAGTKNTSDHGEQQVIIPVVEKMKQKQEMQLTMEKNMENNNRVEEARTKNTNAHREQVIIPKLDKSRKYKKYMYFNMNDILQLTEA